MNPLYRFYIGNMDACIKGGEHMKTVRLSTLHDYADWLKLAKEVEPLFGPMTDDPVFCDGLRQAILEGSALCIIESENEKESGLFLGGIVISKEANEILWLAIARHSRGQKAGAALLSEAIRQLDYKKPITVTTFDQTIEAGVPARRLYESAGFRDLIAAGSNPAGISTVVMVLEEPNAGHGMQRPPASAAEDNRQLP
jgi:ribosomal protein S18 acetylase RimI-like enzyme